MSSSDRTLWAMRLTPDDRFLLEALAEAEQLPKSEIFRRGLRLYAEALGHETHRSRTVKALGVLGSATKRIAKKG